MASEQAHRALVFLMGTEDMRRLFDDWPNRMQLAVCLKEDGDCRMLVHREEEGARFLPRLRSAMSLPLREICFFPEIEGYPTRKILYSEEKQLLSLVRNSPEIVEEATDYSINYTFAMDEGLDPIRFLTANQTPKPQPRAPKPETRQAPRAAPAPKPENPRMETAPPRPVAKPTPEPAGPAGSKLPKFMQKAGKSEPGPAFQSLEQIKAHNPLPKTCTIHDERDGWIAIDLPGCIGGKVAVSNPGQIFVRDDRRVIALQSDLISRDGGPLPGHISLGVKYLPDGLRDILVSSTGKAQLSVENGFLFIALKPKAKRSEKKRPATHPLRRFGSYWRLWASAAAGAAVVAFGLQLTSVPTSPSDADTEIDWSQYQSGSLQGNRDPAVAPISLALNRIEG